MATDLIYDIEVSEDKSSIKLKVEIPARIRAKDPIIEFGDKNALDVLRDAGMLEGYTLEKSNVKLSNWYENHRTNTWVFLRETDVAEKIKKVSPEPVVAATAAPVSEEATTTTAPTATTSTRKKSSTRKRRTKVTTTESTS